MEDIKFKFSIPDLWSKIGLITKFLEIIKKHPDYLKDKVEISTIFGSVPCLWNGGRFQVGYCDKNKLDTILSNVYANDVSTRYTFTNSLIGEELLTDYTGNKILQITLDKAKSFNKIPSCTVNRPELHDYIEKKYPDYKLVWSTTCGFSQEDIDKINFLTEKDDLVLPIKLNKNAKFLSQLKHPENIEVLCIDGVCEANCPDRPGHEKLQSFLTLGYEEYPNDIELILDKLSSNKVVCRKKQLEDDFYSSLTKPYVIKPQDLMEYYNNFGISKFKLSGRDRFLGLAIPLIESIVIYTIKEEYQNSVRYQLLSNLMDTLINKNEKLFDEQV